MKRTSILVTVIALCILAFTAAIMLLCFPALAKPAANSWEYSAITGAYAAYPTEDPNISFTSAVNICYMQMNGCRNEEITSGVSYSRFIQDNRLENNQRSMELARHRALDNAYAKAFAKLGAEGWELISSPDLQFDTFFQNAKGTFDVQEGKRDRKGDIYFKRAK